MQSVFIESLATFLAPYGYFSFTEGAYKKQVQVGEIGIVFSITSYPDGMMLDCFSGIRIPKVENLITPYTQMPNESTTFPRFTLLLNFNSLNPLFPKRAFLKNEMEATSFLDSIYDALELGIFQWLDSLQVEEKLNEQMKTGGLGISQHYFHALRHLALLKLTGSPEIPIWMDYYSKKINSDPQLIRYEEFFKRFSQEILLIERK